MRMITRSVGFVAVIALAGSLSTMATAAPSSVAGKWNVSVESHDGTMSASMILTQDGKKVAGTFSSDHTGDVPLEGDFTEGRLTFSIAFDGGHGSMSLSFSATFKEDGTLAGTLSSPMGDMTWTGTRAKDR